MTNRRALAVAVRCLPGSRSSARARLVAQTIQRALYVSVLNEAGAPVPDLGPSDFIVREDNVAREVLKVEPATEPMQIACSSTTARPRATTSRTSARRCPASSRPSPARPRQRKNEVAHHRDRRAADDPHRLHLQPRQAEEGDRSHLVAAQAAAPTCSTAIVETCARVQEARRPAAGDRRDHGRGPRVEQPASYDQVLDPLRDDRRGVSTPSRSVSRRAASATRCANRAIVLDDGPRDTGGSAISC